MKTRLKPNMVSEDLKDYIFYTILSNGLSCFNTDELLKSHRDYGKIIKDESGKLKCHICGKSFRGLFSHVWQSHNIKLRDYKILFGITQRTSLISEDIKEIKKEYVTGEVKEKLLNDGYKTRYKNK